ncbi:uncharacterized protein EV420DRAFT_1272626 [Desarmillaria tabescens]|uniref:Uncharacterized protein n=1 Tax=Armillaria tabescens TaxID=1929756 RepID=A0AA39K6J0_ARMTA|nr:uncharacterized protein EV420DRAFT_1272626 [Desarmillaria tabescens]KAK0455489.1 hypothetical protein EV420DRAFT_1272626 [Desarmillaria tabescens]
MLSFFLSFFLPAVFASPISCRSADVDFYNPLLSGGSMLDKSAGLGEPLNVIISAKSTSTVLDINSPLGAINYFRAIGFSIECFGQHLGTPQSANLGDGRGDVNETAVIRQDFNIPILGTCIESLTGGNHFRVFPQTGPAANSGALFLAVSKEEDLSESHNIIPDGYDIGRFVINHSLPPPLENTVTWVQKYVTEVTNLTGLLQVGSEGINHCGSVGIAIDGVVKMLTVTATLDLPFFE